MISPFIYGRLLGIPSGGVVYLNEQWEPLRLYALFKASKDATRAIRVRRTISPAEQDFGFDGVELDIAGILAFCGAGDGFVTRIYDQSSVPVDAWMTVAGEQPFIVQAGVLCTKNGKPSLRALAAARRTLRINNAVIGAIGAQIGTEVIVCSTSEIDGGSIVQYVVSGGVSKGILIGGDPAYYFGAGYYLGGPYIDSNVKTTNQMILAGENNGTSPTATASFWVNGTVYDNNVNIGTTTINTSILMGVGSGYALGIRGDFQFYMSFTDSIKADIPALTEQLNEYYGTY
jgi:hypothetical protein